MSNTVIGFGTTFLDPDNPEDPKIEAITAPVDSRQKADLDRATTLDINIKDIFKVKPSSVFEQSLVTGDEPGRVDTQDITFDRRNCVVDRLGRLPETRHWFERSDNPAFNRLKLMYVVKGRSCEGKTFLTPCPIVAVYYLPHTKLLEAAMSGHPLEERYDLYDPDLTRWHPETPNVHIKRGVNIKLAPHLARYIIDQHVAGRAFHQIHSRSMHAVDSLDGLSQPSLYMPIPANGTLTWHVKAIDTGQIVWVIRILDCNSPPPFRTLLITKDRRISTETIKHKHVDSPRRQARPDDGQKVLEPGARPDIALETIELKDDEEEVTRTGFDQCNVKLVHKIHYHQYDKTIISTDEPIPPFLLGTGTPTADRNAITPVEYTSSERMSYDSADNGVDNPSKIQSLFETAIAKAAYLHPGITLIQLSATKPASPPLNSNILPNLRKLHRIPWCRRHQITGETQKEREANWHELARRFYIAQLTVRKTYLYIVGFILFETRSDTSAILAFGDPKDPSSEKHIVDEVVAYAASRKDWPLQLDDSLINFGYRRKKHHPSVRQLSDDQKQSFDRYGPHLMSEKILDIISEFFSYVEHEKPLSSRRN